MPPAAEPHCANLEHRAGRRRRRPLGEACACKLERFPLHLDELLAAMETGQDDPPRASAMRSRLAVDERPAGGVDPVARTFPVAPESRRGAGAPVPDRQAR